MASGYSTTLSVKPKSITLKREDVKVLCEIVSKMITGNDRYAYLSLTISGEKESVSARNTDELIRARWPSDVEDLDFHAYADDSGRSIRLKLTKREWYNQITVSGLDTDWVSARVKELEDFIQDHRNMHWVFHNRLSTVPQGVLLWFLVADTFVKVFSIPKDGSSVVITLTAVFVYVLYRGLAALYPFVFVDDGRQNTSKLIRRGIAFLLPTLFATLIGAIIAKWV